jgi:hypothetical protein
MHRTRHLRLPFTLVSCVVVWFLAPGLIGLWFFFLGALFAHLPRPWQVRRPPRARTWSPEGQRWLRRQLRTRPSARVYVLWSEAQWALHTGSLPPQPRRFFTRAPV